MKKNFKKLFGVIGFPLGHSYSPNIHNFWIKQKKIIAKYKKFEIKVKGLNKVIEKIRNREINGLNVTIPYKIKVIKFLDAIEGDAKITQSVNTILFKNGKVVGENTDVYGIQRGFLKKIKNIKKKTVFILGAGGVVPSIILALKKNHVKKIVLCNRTMEKIKTIRKLFNKKFLSIKWKNRNKFMPRADIIFNATSLGMKKKPELNINTDLFKKKAIYCEIIYNPLKTETIKKLNKLNIKSIDGLDMFIYQAEKSFILWHKKKPKLTLQSKRKIFNKLL